MIMQYKVYDSDDKLHGTFETISDLELYMDGVRNRRGDRYKAVSYTHLRAHET